MSIDIENRFGEVEKLVVMAQAKNLEFEIAAYYCKLGCVMICGTIERSVEILITERVGGRSAPQVKSFFKSFFKRGTNYDCEEILQLLHKFDGDWGQRFRAFIARNEQIKSSIASCYAIRNSVAHGGSHTTGPQTLKQYYDDAFTPIAELDNLLKA